MSDVSMLQFPPNHHSSHGSHLCLCTCAHGPQLECGPCKLLERNRTVHPITTQGLKLMTPIINYIDCLYHTAPHSIGAIGLIYLQPTKLTKLKTCAINLISRQ